MVISRPASSLDDLTATGVSPDVFLHAAIDKVPHERDAIKSGTTFSKR